MAGTPIKIPGKNTRDSSKSAVLARKIMKRPRGRPLKLQSSKSASHTSHSSTSALPVSKVRTMKNIKSKRKMSQLEKLPTELLETIFLHCLNLNMPACSPVIGGKLSSEFIYSKIIIHAFGPIWNDWYGKLIDPDRQGATGDHALQSAILKFRWAKLPVLLRSQDLWARKYAQERPFPIAITWEVIERHNLEDASGIKHVNPKAVSAAELIDNDFANYCHAFQRVGKEYGIALKHNYFSRLDMLSYANVARGTEIPHTLLMGPWDEEAIKFLFWLVMGGARIDWLSSTSGEAAIIGYKSAVREGKLEVMLLLLLAGVRNKLDDDIIQYTIAMGDNSRVFFTILLMLDYAAWLSNSKMKTEEMPLFKTNLDHEEDSGKLEMIKEFESWWLASRKASLFMTSRLRSLAH